MRRRGETVPWVRIPLSPPFLRHSSPQYPIVRIYRKATEEFRDFALILRASCSFSPWVRRKVLPPLHPSPLYPLFESTAKTMGSAIKAVAVSPLIAAKTVAFGSRFGEWILRGRPGVRLSALRVAVRLPKARSGQRVRQFPNYWKHLFEDTPLCGAVDLVMKRNDIGDSYVFGCSSGSLRRSRYFSLALSGVRNAVGDGGAARGSMRIPAHRPPDGAASVANFRDAPPPRTTA
jgi:hypothetical protein